MSEIEKKMKETCKAPPIFTSIEAIGLITFFTAGLVAGVLFANSINENTDRFVEQGFREGVKCGIIYKTMDINATAWAKNPLCMKYLSKYENAARNYIKDINFFGGV